MFFSKQQPLNEISGYAFGKFGLHRRRREREDFSQANFAPKEQKEASFLPPAPVPVPEAVLELELEPPRPPRLQSLCRCWPAAG